MLHATHAEAKNYRNVNEMANTLADSKRSALMSLPGIPCVQVSVGDFSHFRTGAHCSYLIDSIELVCTSGYERALQDKPGTDLTIRAPISPTNYVENLSARSCLKYETQESHSKLIHHRWYHSLAPSAASLCSRFFLCRCLRSSSFSRLLTRPS